jgi:hypothetical protein
VSVAAGSTAASFFLPDVWQPVKSTVVKNANAKRVKAGFFKEGKRGGTSAPERTPDPQI